MKSLILLAVAAALVSASTAEAKGIRIRIGGPRATVPAPKPAALPQQVAPRQAMPGQAMPGQTMPQQALPQQMAPRRAAGSSGGVFIIPGRSSVAGASERRGLHSSDWQTPEARQATPDWFKAAASEAARGASQSEPSAAAPRARKAAFQCAPDRLAGGFCMLN